MPSLASRVRTQSQCAAWNTDKAHQRAAGKARAARFTIEHQRAAGHASFSAQSAKWRAHQGLAPLDSESAAKYLTVEDVRHLARPVAPAIAQAVYRAWCAGQLIGVAAWLALEPDELPPEPGGLWALTCRPCSA